MRLEGEIGTFVRQYARKRHPSHDPNDRAYDRQLEQQIRHMKPEELDVLMNGDPEEDLGEG